ncbi:MAG: hypothetical protein EOO38_00265 [Cytophagaceae bacterium]|nr:MAG: hypothetical protein EOO38_00265 [Cytophagaceae bacterium]
MRRLKDLTIHEISLVKRAANKRKFLVTKTAGEPMPAPDLEKIRDSLLSVPEPVLKAVEAVAKGTFAKDDSTMTLTDDQQARLKAAGRMLQPVIQDVPMDAITQMLAAIGATGTDALMDSDIAESVDADTATDAAAVDTAADVQAADTLASDAVDAADAATQAAAMASPDMPATADATAVTDDDKRAQTMKAALEKSKAVYTQMMKDAGFEEDEDEQPVDKGADIMKSGEIMKSADALAKKHRDELADMKKKHLEAVSKSCDLQLKLDKQEMIAKAAQLPHLGAADKLVTFLLNNKQKDPDGFAENFNVMKAWNDTMSKSDIFSEVGSQAVDTSNGDAESRINQMVMNLVQKSGGMSPQQAYTQVVTRTPEGQAAYKEYMDSSLKVKGN